MTVAASEEAVTPVGRSRPVPVAGWAPPGVTTLRADQQAILELVFDTFCRRFAEELTTVIRLPVELRVRPARLLLWRDVLAELPEPYSACLARWSPDHAGGLVVVSVPLAVAYVDRLLGGPGAPSEHPGPLTEVENELVADLHRRVAAAYAASLAAVAAVDATVGPHEPRLGLLRALPADAELVVADVEVTAGAAAGEISLVLPAPLVIPALDAFAGRVAPDPQRPQLPPTGGLLDATVEVSVRFEPASLTPGELCRLAVGDVIGLPHDAATPLQLWVANHPYLRVQPGRRAGQVAVAVAD